MKRIVCLGVILVMVVIMMVAFTACAPKQRGNFYTLQEAYEQGLLTQDHLKSIAYYQNGESEDEEFEPMPKKPSTLTEQTEKAIKETRAYDLRNQDTKPIKEAKAKDITILKYYGTYNNCIALMLDDIYHDYPTALREVIIEGVVFRYSDGNSILIWKEEFIEVSISEHEPKVTHFKSLEFKEDKEAYIFDNASDYFEFTPNITGYYNINYDNSYNGLSCIIKNNNIEISISNNIGYYLEQGNTYQIELKNQSDQKIRPIINIDISTKRNNISIDYIDEYLFKYAPTETKPYVFTTNNSNCRLKRIYYYETNGDETTMLFGSKEMLPIILDSTKEYYIVVDNVGESTETFSIDITNCPELQSNSIKTLSPLYQNFYKFVVPYSSDYEFVTNHINLSQQLMHNDGTIIETLNDGTTFSVNKNDVVYLWASNQSAVNLTFRINLIGETVTPNSVNTINGGVEDKIYEYNPNLSWNYDIDVSNSGINTCIYDEDLNILSENSVEYLFNTNINYYIILSNQSNTSFNFSIMFDYSDTLNYGESKQLTTGQDNLLKIDLDTTNHYNPYYKFESDSTVSDFVLYSNECEEISLLINVPDYYELDCGVYYLLIPSTSNANSIIMHNQPIHLSGGHTLQSGDRFYTYTHITDNTLTLKNNGFIVSGEIEVYDTQFNYLSNVSKNYNNSTDEIIWSIDDSFVVSEVYYIRTNLNIVDNNNSQQYLSIISIKNLLNEGYNSLELDVESNYFEFTPNSDGKYTLRYNDSQITSFNVYWEHDNRWIIIPKYVVNSLIEGESNFIFNYLFGDHNYLVEIITSATVSNASVNVYKSIVGETIEFNTVNYIGGNNVGYSLNVVENDNQNTICLIAERGGVITIGMPNVYYNYAISESNYYTIIDDNEIYLCNETSEDITIFLYIEDKVIQIDVTINI